MSEPTLTMDHQATLQSSPVTNPPPPPVKTETAPVDQYQPPVNPTPDRYQEPHQFLQNPSPSSQTVPPPQDNSNPDTVSTNQGVERNNYQQTSDLFPGVVKPIPEETVLEWAAPSRPHKPRKKQYFTTIAIFVVLLSAILFFLSQFLLIGVILAVAFMVYVLEVVPPTMVRYSLTTYGIRIENILYYWEELGRFWYSEKYGQKILHVEVARFPNRLTLLLGEVPETEMTEILSEVLLQQRPEMTIPERLAERLQQLIPLEN